MMKFNIPVRKNPNLRKYKEADIKIAREFGKKLYNELGNFLKGLIIFGSAVKEKRGETGDIDILVIVDDITMRLTPELVEAFRIITEKTIAETSKRLHVITLKFTSFWEYIRNGDPIAINMLRDGVALIDTGFFDPLQVLLMQGRIRPTSESIWTYYMRSPQTLQNSKWHISQATLDLYWAVIDSAHASLMKLGVIPPSPDHIAEYLEEKMVKTNLLEEKYAVIMKNFYKLAKQITHREIKEIKGEEFDKYLKQAQSFVDRMKIFIEKK